MLSIKRPTDEKLGQFLAQCIGAGLSYDPTSLSESSAGFNFDEEPISLGWQR